MKARKLGSIGEEKAAAYLESNGFSVLEKNYFTKCGEIDIIFKDEDVICFAEVKYRRGHTYGTPAEAVTVSKMRKVTAAALDYLYRKDLCDEKCRFDIIEVYGPGMQVRHIKNAFDAVI